MLKGAVDDRRAWLIVTMAAAANALGMPLELAIDASVPGTPLWPSASSALVGFILLGYLWLLRKQATLRVAAIVYMINAVSIAAAFHWTNSYFAVLGPQWIPFQGDKLGCVVAAMLAPTLATGILSILLYALGPALQFYSFPAEVRAGMATGEPWAVLAFGVAAVMLLAHRFSRLKLERQLALAQGEKLAGDRFAVTALYIRDLMNTPLQTLEIATALLREHAGHDADILDGMQRAIARLASLNATLAKYERLQPWEAGSMLSFDALKELDSPHTFDGCPV